MGCIAIGDGAVAGQTGVAIGVGASTSGFSESIALGNGAAATANNQLALGGISPNGGNPGAVDNFFIIKLDDGNEYRVHLTAN